MLVQTSCFESNPASYIETNMHWWRASGRDRAFILVGIAVGIAISSTVINKHDLQPSIAQKGPPQRWVVRERARAPGRAAASGEIQIFHPKVDAVRSVAATLEVPVAAVGSVCKGTEVRAHVAFPGGTFKTLGHCTVFKCCEFCLADEQCTHWTLQGEECHLKHAWGKRLPGLPAAAAWDTGAYNPAGNATYSGWRILNVDDRASPAADPSWTKIHLVAYSDTINRGTCCLLATAAHQQWVPEITANLPTITDKQGKLLEGKTPHSSQQ